MKDININANNIGTNIIADEANIDNVSSHTEINHAQVEQELIDSILSYSKELNEQKLSLSPEQLQLISTQLIDAMKQVQQESDQEKKKDIVKGIVKTVKETLGITSDVLNAFFKLASLFGVE